MADLPFHSGSAPSDAIADVHRKLAVLRAQFSAARQPFLAGPLCRDYSDELAATIAEFNAQIGHSAGANCDAVTWQALCDQAGLLFDEAWQCELDSLTAPAATIAARPAEREDLLARAAEKPMLGLALSGGGIRSATFNLGILQALAQRGLLNDIDYLSTVSGGGYIGGWFSKLLAGEGGQIDRAAAALSPKGKAESGAIRFLRQYSNFMTPQTGFFSADTWSLLATAIRNAALNLGIVVLLLASVLLIPRLLTYAVGNVDDVDVKHLGGFAIAMALWAVGSIGFSISADPEPARPRHLRGQSQTSILLVIVVPLMAAAFTGSIALWMVRVQVANVWWDDLLSWFWMPGCAYFAAWVAGWALAEFLQRKTVAIRGRVLEGVGHFLFAVIALGIGSTLMVAILRGLTPPEAVPEQTIGQGALAIHLVVFGMPALLLVFGVTMIISIGLTGKLYADKSREWWSRQGGWTIICTVVWSALMALCLYAPPLVGYAIFRAPVWLQTLLTSAWLGSTVAGVALGRSPATGKREGTSMLDWIAMLAPPIFALGAVALIATLSYTLVSPFGLAPFAEAGNLAGAFERYFWSIEALSPGNIAVTAVALGACAWLLSRRVDINKFSLYMMYRNRLVRAYLGATTKDRAPHPFTGFDENDEVQLSGLVQRPLHILNGTLNLVGGKELAWQTRKAAAFSFSPHFCGFELPSMEGDTPTAGKEAARGCYRPTAWYNKNKDAEDGVKLGMAMAVSGAAASPAMGYHSSPPLAFLMTLFNVRLGRWFPNPLKSGLQDLSPKHGLPYLLSELFGMSDASSKYLYLSDGGHFENLGIYELVRRRCRLIIAIDASADGDLQFEDLGNAIRKCATDLHVEIDIDVSEIDRIAPSEFSRAYCVAGKVLYSQTDASVPDGTILYIKPVLLGTELADVLNYRKQNKDFPHQSTADQWFDETQFESYRSLGYRIGMVALEHARAGDVPAMAAALAASWSKEGRLASKRERRNLRSMGSRLRGGDA